LWVAKVHHLVQQLVYDDEVIPDRLFFELFKVLGEDFNDFVEKKEDFCGVGVTFGEGEKVKV